jgi:glycosyltransferase involved in cell wall biosynthesis
MINVKILVLSLYYAPDLSAGSFRCTAFIEQLKQLIGTQGEIDVITTMPNRYTSFRAQASKVEHQQGVTIRRIAFPPHHGSLFRQIKSYAHFVKEVYQLTKSTDYSLVFTTSGRLMSAVLGASIARKKKAPLYLDIRDIFLRTIDDVFSKKSIFAIKPLFSFLERWAFNQASCINLVSPGFQPYFNARYPHTKLSYFTNGVDPEFVTFKNLMPQLKIEKPKRLTVLYAGNIGEGQGLDKIIPELAKRFETSLDFKIIGDGGKQACLMNKIKETQCHNVELLPPVERKTLIKHYQQADILFLHLNNYDAFHDVLPSKVFEYAATEKPIWAGVSGYPAEFIQKEIENAAIFSPCNASEAEDVFIHLKLSQVSRNTFVDKYARRSIMRNMATDVLSLIKA